MPKSFRARRAKTRPRRAFRKFKIRRKAKAKFNHKSIVNLGLHFPEKIIMKHAYAEAFDLTAAGASYAHTRFSCNSMYDPYAPLGGAQPYCFDQMAALYNRYTVVGARITVRLTPAAESEDPGFVGVYINDDNVDNNDIDLLRERSGKRNYVMTPAGMNQVYTFTKNWSLKKSFGKTNLSQKDFFGTSLASPVVQEYFDVWMYPVGGNGCSFFVNVDIEYIAVWTNEKDFAPS